MFQVKKSDSIVNEVDDFFEACEIAILLCKMYGDEYDVYQSTQKVWSTCELSDNVTYVDFRREKITLVS